MSPSTDTKKPPKPKLVKVRLGDETREIPAGDYLVSELKVALGVPPEAALYLKEHGRKRLLADQETITVKAGLKFEYVIPGGVS